MEVIKLLKDVVSFAQKSDNIEIIEKTITAQQEIIDLQEKLNKLKQENFELKQKLTTKSKILHYRNVPIITIEGDSKKILYCANCYGKDKTLIPLRVIHRNQCYCGICKNNSYITDSPDASQIKELFN